MATTVDLRVECAWCKTVLHEGHPTGPDQISHGCCCACKLKYFPTMGDTASECDFELVEREHETDAQPTGYNYATEQITETEYHYHVDLERCTACHLERTQRTDCDCEPDDDGPGEEDRGEVRFDESEVANG